MNKIQFFDIETSVNDTRNIKGFELENKIKMILISDPNINFSSCSVAVGAGYLQDEYPGTAHFLEHLLFMGSEKYPEQNDYHSYIQINGGQDNAFTGDTITCYYLALETSFLKKGIEMLSWFFRAPLLNESHIESEMEIIDSEHNKNILSDSWIMDDIFKNFIKSNSKYKKFGTGNLKSLNNITKEDIMKFYDKYYTTDNLYVCIVDSKNINQMMNDYVGYFQNISPKFSSDENRFNKNNLELITNDLIFFNSSSEYLIVNYYIILDALETDLIEFQLVQFINYLIGTEYKDSFAYYFKENNIAKNVSANIEYFYDYSTNINIQLIMTNDEENNIKLSYFMVLKLLNYIKNLTEDEFIKLYNNYKKINTLKLLYDSTNNPISISNDVVENIIKGDMSEAIVRNNKVPEYSNFVFEKYKSLLNDVKIKMTTNINFKNISKDEFIDSKWYSSSYYIDNIPFKENEKNDLNKIKFNIENIIGIENFIIKNEVPDMKNNVFTHDIPELIYTSNEKKRKIYLIECNKYNKPIGSITIIRKNNLLLNKNNKILIEIYENLCDRVLNYFLDVFGYYKLNFSVSTYKEHLIYNFIGINYELNFFSTQIIKQIHPDTLLYNNPKAEKYFNEIIRDMKDKLINFKYNSPYTICSKYISYLLNNNLLPEEKFNLLNKLTWKDFVTEIDECLKYTQEYYILIGIKKYGYKNLIFPTVNYNFKSDQYLNDIIDALELNPNKYLFVHKPNHANITNSNFKHNLIVNANAKTNIEIKEKHFNNYTINSFDTNPNEINNCLTRYWVCSDEIKLIYDTDDKNVINIEITKLIIKLKLIMSFVSEILNEPLFDKIRTIDKLGYIVKADNKIVSPSDDSLYFIIVYLIQSSYTVDRIFESLNNFSKFISKDIKNNHSSYLEKFKILKKSKMIELKKPFTDIVEELSSYIESIVSKNFIFDINELYLDICSKIDFTNDIEPIIYKITKKNSEYYDIVLKKLI